MALTEAAVVREPSELAVGVGSFVMGALKEEGPKEMEKAEAERAAARGGAAVAAVTAVAALTTPMAVS